jgi:hypothetical protein
MHDMTAIERKEENGWIQPNASWEMCWRRLEAKTIMPMILGIIGIITFVCQEVIEYDE